MERDIVRAGESFVELVLLQLCKLVCQLLVVHLLAFVSEGSRTREGRTDIDPHSDRIRNGL